MNMPLVRMLGRWAIDRSQSSTRMFHILARTCAALLRLSFLKPAVALVLVRQVYFTAVQPLSIILVASLVMGSVTVHYLLQLLLGLGAYEQIGSFLIRVMLHEIAPITCSLIILLRSGTAVLTELALMKINGEIDTLHSLNIAMDDYVYLPRIVAFALAGPCLSIVFCLIALLGGFMILGYWHDITFANYKDRLFNALEIKDLIVLVTKSTIMSVVACLVALQRGFSADRAFTEIPVLLIQGMMQSITLLIGVEILFSLF
jgi:phospholipid/cholesterol/gamma-HCH transport system permease protein